MQALEAGETESGGAGNQPRSGLLGGRLVLHHRHRGKLGGLNLVLAPCWAVPLAMWVESGRCPEEVVRPKGRTMSLCGHTGSPFACISSVPG